MFNQYVSPQSRANLEYVRLVIFPCVGFDDVDMMKYLYGYGM